MMKSRWPNWAAKYSKYNYRMDKIGYCIHGLSSLGIEIYVKDGRRRAECLKMKSRKVNSVFWFCSFMLT